ncbi:hypothetical protein [Chondromyces apiculatus]|uniref:Lipoprotein n=1 Tax=Chondromyces apiculatus DSM 436 TaxID=1192034 RepID=A0A017T3M5_9BACT|nr:hypothetical protein [Chondromyces apiculatus]EYF03859.1 Hypothetical protein CAP_5123 [Chondromyces apiculatus DSM 436]
MTSLSKKLALLGLILGALATGCLSTEEDGEGLEVDGVSYESMEGPIDTNNGLHPDRVYEALGSFNATLDNRLLAPDGTTIDQAQSTLGFPDDHSDLFSYLVRAALPQETSVQDSNGTSYPGEGLLNLQGAWETGTLTSRDQSSIRETVWAFTKPYGHLQIWLSGMTVKTPPHSPGPLGHYYREAVWSSYRTTSPNTFGGGEDSENARGSSEDPPEAPGQGQWRDVVYIFSGHPALAFSSTNGLAPPSSYDVYRYCGNYAGQGCSIERVVVQTMDNHINPAGYARFMNDCVMVPRDNQPICNGVPAVTSYVTIHGGIAM